MVGNAMIDSWTLLISHDEFRYLAHILEHSQWTSIQLLTRQPLMMLTQSPVQGRISVSPLQWEQYCILTKPRPHSLDNVTLSVAFTTSPASLSNRLNARPTPNTRDRLLSKRRGWGPNGLTSCRVIVRQSLWLAWWGEEEWYWGDTWPIPGLSRRRYTKGKRSS